MSIDKCEKIRYSAFMNTIFKGKLRKRIACFVFSTDF